MYKNSCCWRLLVEEDTTPRRSLMYSQQYNMNLSSNLLRTMSVIEGEGLINWRSFTGTLPR